MSLANHISTRRHELSRTGIVHILGISAFIFVFGVLIFFLLHRVGVPIQLILKIMIAGLILAVGILCWIGRSMDREPFFFARRVADPASIGTGGLTDWVSGATLILFFSSSILGKLVLAPALMFGLFLQAILFAMTFQKSGVSTLPGFFSWRTQRRITGITALVPTAIILGLLIVAEFSVARELLLQMTTLNPTTIVWIILIFATLPSLAGGWLSLLLVNGAMAIGILLCILLPSVVTGFFPNLLQAGLELDFGNRGVPVLSVASSTALNLLAGQTSVPTLLVSIMVMAAGFSVLPHGLSRVSLSGRQIAAVESLGWSALVTFLVFSAMPLSIGLIGATPSSAKLALLLKGNPVLHMLPYMALLLAALNALAVTIFALSSAVVRTTRRSRNLDPGEQSMFAIRLSVVVISFLLTYLPQSGVPSSGNLLVAAISLGAASLFVPLVSAIWLPTLKRGTLSVAMVVGAAILGAKFLGVAILDEWTVLSAGALGMLAAAVVVAVGLLLARSEKQLDQDDRLLELRNFSVNR